MSCPFRGPETVTRRGKPAAFVELVYNRFTNNNNNNNNNKQWRIISIPMAIQCMKTISIGVLTFFIRFYGVYRYSNLKDLF